MTRAGRGITATLTIIAVLSVGASAAASPGSSAPAGSAAPASTHVDKHPATDPARIPRVHRMPQPDPPAARWARKWAAEDPYSRFVCFTPDGAVATTGVVDRVDPSRPLTADQLQQLCHLGSPGSSP